MRNWFLGGIILLAFLLRVVNLASFPTGFTADEASFGYDAYSLLITGKDQWGQSFPLALRSFGDFKLPVYAYLAVPSVAIFGLSELATRLPAALIGTLAVLVTYLMVFQLFRGRKLALLSSFLLAISSWHVMLSRGAFEANLTTFFAPLGVWAFLRGRQDPRWMAVAALAFGLNIFSYHSARVFTPLLAGLLLWGFKDSFAPVGQAIKKYRWSALIFASFIFLAFFTVFSGGAERSKDASIFSPTDKWQEIAERRFETVQAGFPDQLARVFSNKATFLADQFVTGYLSYVSPEFLFTEGPAEWSYGMIPGRGVAYLVEVVFILAALWWVVIKRGNKGPITIVLFWILLALIPPALAKGQAAGHRAATTMPALQIISAFGVVTLFSILKKRFKVKEKLYFTSFALLMLLSLAFFLEDYVYHAPKNSAPAMAYGMKDAISYISSVEDRYETIVLSQSFSEPQIFVGFYKKWDPADYQAHTQDWLRYKEENLTFLDQLGEYRLGKYLFRSIDYSRDSAVSSVLIVGKPKDFPPLVVPTKIINYPSGEPAIFIVDPRAETYARQNQ